MPKFEIPIGWIAKGFEFEVEWPGDPARVSLIRSHFGARRFAYNWALALIKADAEAWRADASHRSVRWHPYALVKRWNADKATVAPWWRENSKYAYETAMADLCMALDAWQAYRSGKRKGRKVGFPRFQSKSEDWGRVRFRPAGKPHLTACEADRRTITLPTVGQLRSKESTRRLQRLVAKGNARVLNATLHQRWGRLFVSFGCIVKQQHHAPPVGGRVGVDLGLRYLATVVDDDGKIVKFPNPAPLRATLAERQSASRQMSRRIVGSRGHSAAKAKLAALDRRCVNLRSQASHSLTSWLAANYREVVIEDLSLAGMVRSMKGHPGGRQFRRAVTDAALGRIRPQLVYKTQWRGVTLMVADRFFASSRMHHGCGCALIERRTIAQFKACAVTGELVDRDVNAALNIRDWPDNASCSAVGAAAPFASESSGGQDTGSSGAVGGRVRPEPSARAVSVEARTRKGTSRRGAARSGDSPARHVDGETSPGPPVPRHQR